MSLFAALETLCSNAARAAASIGMTRQAYQQAQRRGQLSPLYTIRAAVLLGLNPATVILEQIAETLPETERAALKNAAMPAQQPTSSLAAQPEKCMTNELSNTNYTN